MDGQLTSQRIDGTRIVVSITDSGLERQAPNNKTLHQEIVLPPSLKLQSSFLSGVRISSSIMDHCDRKSVVGKACLKWYYSISLIPETLSICSSNPVPILRHGSIHATTDCHYFLNLLYLKRAKANFPLSASWPIFYTFIKIKCRVNMTSCFGTVQNGFKLILTRTMSWQT